MRRVSSRWQQLHACGSTTCLIRRAFSIAQLVLVARDRPAPYGHTASNISAGYVSISIIARDSLSIVSILLPSGVSFTAQASSGTTYKVHPRSGTTGGRRLKMAVDLSRQVDKAKRHIAEGEKHLAKWSLFSGLNKHEDAAECFKAAGNAYKVSNRDFNPLKLCSCGPCSAHRTFSRCLDVRFVYSRIPAPRIAQGTP